MAIQLIKPSIHQLLFILLIILLLSTKHATAQTPISNGKIFVCQEKEIISVKSDQPVTLKNALKRFNAIILRTNGILATAEQGSSQFKKARKQKRNAVQGKKDARGCIAGELKTIVGNWNLITENGSTPNELGYESLTIVFTESAFESTFTGTSLTCDWTGTYTNPGKGTILILLTNTGVGGTACEEAIGQFRSTTFELSEDGDTLTLDYRPEGTLQVFERVS